MNDSVAENAASVLANDESDSGIRHPKLQLGDTPSLDTKTFIFDDFGRLLVQSELWQ